MTLKMSLSRKKQKKSSLVRIFDNTFLLFIMRRISLMRKISGLECQARRWMEWLAFVGQALEAVIGKEADILCEDLVSIQI